MGLIDRLQVLAKQHLGRPLRDYEQRAADWYAPDGATPEELLEFFKAADNAREERRGRGGSQACIDVPEWWGYYWERATRQTWGEWADGLRPALGIDTPLDESAALGWVQDVIARAGVAEQGAYTVLTVPAGTESEHVVLWAGDTQSRGRIDLMSHDKFFAVLRSVTAPLGYRALLVVAYGGGASTLRNLGATYDEFARYILCGTAIQRPWLRWDLDSWDAYTESLTLHIPSIIATPEQVRALYEQARDEIAEAYEPEGCPVPVAVSSEPMRLVRFVESRSAGGTPDWEQLHKDWKDRADKAGSDYKNPASMKAAYYEAAVPVKQYHRKAGKGL